jgi:hypothetical protein
LQKLDDLAADRVSPELRLLEDRPAVARDLESSTTGRLELDVGARKNRSELGRQTGGPGLVASNSAILDFDFHLNIVVAVVES